MGVYSTLTLGGWNHTLLDAIGASRAVLPEILDGNRVGGRITPDAARQFGLLAGTPMTVGLMDTSAAMLLAGARAGHLVNTSGSTDVLALCTNRPSPHEHLLTRPLGIGRQWLAVSTIAAAGSAIAWAHRTLFADLSEKRFAALVRTLARDKRSPAGSTVHFDPYLAGDRMSIEQRRGGFDGLTLSTTRDELLKAMIEELARASAARVHLLRNTAGNLRRDVLVSGGVASGLSEVLYRDWPGRWTFKSEPEATLRGLGKMKIV
jgi:sugar (pentulose or hexulose) kinase